jgi:hypothetical protein
VSGFASARSAGVSRGHVPDNRADRALRRSSGVSVRCPRWLERASRRAPGITSAPNAFVELADGSEAREELTAYAAPAHFAYRVNRFTAPRRRCPVPRRSEASRHCSPHCRTIRDAVQMPVPGRNGVRVAWVSTEVKR